MNNFTLPRTRLLLLLILLTALTAGGLAFGLRQSQAQSAQPTVAAPAIYAEARVNVGSLNLRTGPHVSYTAVAYLMDGERVRLVGRNRAGTWAQIELYNGYRGWVNARYLQPGIDIVALPVADVSLLGITAFVTNDPIPVYAGPGTLYRRVGTARPGETLALNGRNDAASWVHVYLPDGQAGWAAADSPFLPSSAINDLPIVTPFLDAPPPELSAFYLVYAGPGFLYEPLDNVVEGQTLGIRGRSADGRWVLVRLENGREGWIAGEIIQVAVPLDNVPVIEGIAPPQVTGWQAAGGSATGDSPTGGKATTAPTEPAANPTQPATDTPAPTATGDGPTGGGKATAVATTDTPATAAPTERPTRAATATRAATRTPAPTATVAATATPEPSPTATPLPATAAPTVAPTATTPPQTTGDGSPTELPVVYVYASPSDENAPILRVVPGQSVVLIGRTADSEWVQIWLPGNQQGWIRASAVQVEIDLDVLPVVEP